MRWPILSRISDLITIKADEIMAYVEAAKAVYDQSIDQSTTSPLPSTTLTPDNQASCP